MGRIESLGFWSVCGVYEGWTEMGWSRPRLYVGRTVAERDGRTGWLRWTRLCGKWIVRECGKWIVRECGKWIVRECGKGIEVIGVMYTATIVFGLRNNCSMWRQLGYK